mgnify:FL=1|jgi:hypothetical protein|nr:MAG TPA: hypothetical protein [Caudoviricetes sp.]DAX76192.1 MAG TPA: hypothetical protein [Caudoviricetes sp.]
MFAKIANQYHLCKRLLDSFMNHIDFSAIFCALNIVVLRSTSIGVFHKIVKNLIVLIFNELILVYPLFNPINKLSFILQESMKTSYTLSKTAKVSLNFSNI